MSDVPVLHRASKILCQCGQRRVSSSHALLEMWKQFSFVCSDINHGSRKFEMRWPVAGPVGNLSKILEICMQVLLSLHLSYRSCCLPIWGWAYLPSRDKDFLHGFLISHLSSQTTLLLHIPRQDNAPSPLLTGKFHSESKRNFPLEFWWNWYVRARHFGAGKS